MRLDGVGGGFLRQYFSSLGGSAFRDGHVTRSSANFGQREAVMTFLS